MAINRISALEKLHSRKPIGLDLPKNRISSYFGENVFDRVKMRQYLSKEAYENVIAAIDRGDIIDRKLGNQIASGMKAWALDKGVTHYTHWFHPLNGSTAEKHDAFIEPIGDNQVIENFDGKQLTQQEPDASSFPSGGIRNTFEARGYTAWDPSSPAFINHNTLCIPTIFVAYTGEALDYKTPLLKSINAIDKIATEVCVDYFDKNVTKVTSNLGWEQEYFLVDKALYDARPDLKLTDRTLMGHASAKDQQLEDHYFGAIPERVEAFMKDLEYEAYLLGIPVKTRHNEVAPNQFELAPVYQEANLSVDHNQLMMSTIKRVANKHNFVALLHEKPYKGVNGSGKHNNWSLTTDTGINLLSPGKNPKTNLCFLVFLVNTIKAVYKHGDILRSSIVSAGNEHRLGADEAPPSIMSVFLGTQISAMLDQLEEKVTDKKMTPDEKTELKLNVGKIPQILLDNTDRNRTSPFAFTGNRFEFRAVGSSKNCGEPMTILNAAVACQLTEFKKETDALIETGIKKDEAVFQILRKYIVESKPVRYDGNGYSKEWEIEAEKRGLTNVKPAIDALKAYISEDAIDMFGKTNVFNKRELEARYEINLEVFSKKIQIESRVLGDLAINHIIPTAVKYQNILIKNVEGLKNIFDDSEFKKVSKLQVQNIKEISTHIVNVQREVKDMIEERKTANRLPEIDKADYYSNKVKPYLDSIRYEIDKLELIVDDEMWPLPKYREMLFTI